MHRRRAWSVLLAALTLAITGCRSDIEPTEPARQPPTEAAQLTRDDLGPKDLVLQEQIPFAIDDIRMIVTIRGSNQAYIQVDGAGVDQELVLTVDEPTRVNGWTFLLLDTTADFTAVRVADPDGSLLGP